MTSRRDSGGRSAGFTLLEIIIVVVILGLVLGLVMQHGPVRSPTLEARAAAAQIAGMLRIARGQAIATNRPVSVMVDLQRHAVAMDGGPVKVLPARIGLSAIATVPETLGQRLAGFRFEPDGSASGGRIELATGSTHIQIGIDWLTGRVRVVDAPHKS